MDFRDKTPQYIYVSVFGKAVFICTYMYLIIDKHVSTQNDILPNFPHWTLRN